MHEAKEMLGRRDLASTRNSSRPHPAAALQPWKGKATGKRQAGSQAGGAGDEPVSGLPVGSAL